ncbi:MAG: DNA replication and repair protein RecF [Chitinispirillales bacterium]|jgi:DNA replication and repair protein RecF|nr:DNA replication and repair protein RecF [Chitinispirillales bacterium]
MFLTNISLINFRSYKNLHVEVPEEGSLFLGENGSGKTNFFEALSVAVLGKSVRGALLREMISINEKESNISVSFIKSQIKTVQSVGFSKNNDIFVKINDILYNSFLCLYGNNGFVYFGVDDIKTVKGIPQEKRQFFDMIISQNDKEYLRDIIKYKSLIKQRNFILSNNMNYDLIDIYDKQISHIAINIINKRKYFFNEITSVCESIYKEISDDDINIKLKYLLSTECSTEIEYYNFLKDNLNKDRDFKFTTGGIHRDNFEFRTENSKLISFGSQGQCKSAAIALKIAAVKYLSKTEKSLIIVIDDAFSDLDISRKQKFFNILNKSGQIFIAIHSKKELDYYPIINYFEVSKGQMKCFRK